MRAGFMGDRSGPACFGHWLEPDANSPKFQQHGNWFPSIVVWVLPCFALIITVCCWNWPRENITKTKMVQTWLESFFLHVALDIWLWFCIKLGKTTVARYLFQWDVMEVHKKPWFARRWGAMEWGPEFGDYPSMTLWKLDWGTRPWIGKKSNVWWSKKMFLASFP